jgi:uncharacterized membrane protein affecting hemolysin expression
MFFQGLGLAQKISLFTAALALLVALLLIGANLQGSRALTKQTVEQLVQPVTEQMARVISQPLMNGDRVALQAQLASLTDGTMISRAVIYDLNQRPVVEAGTFQDEQWTHTQTIVFQDSVIGRLVVSFDGERLFAGTKQLAIQLVILAVLLAAVVYVFAGSRMRYYEQLFRQLRERLQGKMNEDDEIDYFANDELALLIDTIEHPSQRNQKKIQVSRRRLALLHVHLAGLPVWRDQMEPLRLLQYLQGIRQQLDMVTDLYEGIASCTRPNGFSAYFLARDDDDTDYLFRAACAAQLLASLGDPNGYRIGITSVDMQGDYFTAELAAQGNLDELINQLQRAEANQLVIAKHLAEHGDFVRRIDMTARNGLLLLAGMKPPYRELIERQLQALRAQQQKLRLG